MVFGRGFNQVLTGWKWSTIKTVWLRLRTTLPAPLGSKVVFLTIVDREKNRKRHHSRQFQPRVGTILHVRTLNAKLTKGISLQRRGRGGNQSLDEVVIWANSFYVLQQTMKLSSLRVSMVGWKESYKKRSHISSIDARSYSETYKLTTNEITMCQNTFQCLLKKCIQTQLCALIPSQ